VSRAGDREPEEGGSPRIRPFLGASPSAPVPADDPEPTAPRPFVLTSGRVLANHPDIGLETQVSALPHGSSRLSGLPREQQAIVAACAQPLSVAEIAACVRLHLGVTKILVSDLRAAGYLEVHDMDAVNPTDIETILRVIHGLRALA
jgi:uncharacterized protein DUF742